MYALFGPESLQAGAVRGLIMVWVFTVLLVCGKLQSLKKRKEKELFNLLVMVWALLVC